MNSLIDPENVWALWAVIVTWVALSIRLEQRYRWAAKISGPVLVLAGAILLANARILPAESPVYDVIWNYIVPVCIPLLLFRANIRVILRDSGPMFLVFHLSVLGTMIGGLLAVLIVGEAVPSSADLTAIMTGSYTGGSVNFAALTLSLEPERHLADSLIVADNLVMAVLFLVCFSLTSIPFLRRVFSAPYQEAVERGEGGVPTLQAANYWKPKPISLLDIAQALAIAVVVAGGAHLAAQSIRAVLPGDHPVSAAARGILGQPYLLITMVCVVLASVFHRQMERLRGAEELGTYLIYLFFFVIGAPADLIRIVRDVPVLFLLCAIMAVTNLLVTLGLARLFRRHLEEVGLAVNATLGGAPSAAAMAIAKGWTPLVLPSILVGVWGYVIGTPLGLAAGRLLRSLLAD